MEKKKIKLILENQKVIMISLACLLDLNGFEEVPKLLKKQVKKLEEDE